MKQTTLCYIKNDKRYLMLYRNKKKNDQSQGKWLGIGGKFEEGETADECMLREVYEETGLTITKYKHVGIIHFRADIYEDEDMYLYTASEFTGDIISDCNEGELHWVSENEILDLPMWEGDKCFLTPLINGNENINMTLVYEGDKLVSKY